MIFIRILPEYSAIVSPKFIIDIKVAYKVASAPTGHNLEDNIKDGSILNLRKKGKIIGSPIRTRTEFGINVM